MKLDLTDYLAALAPWDFTVKIGTTTYPTRPLTVGDLILIESFGDENDSLTGHATLAKLHNFATSLFVGQVSPDISAWPVEALREVVRAVAAYWGERTKKNTAQVAAKGP